MSDGTFPRDIAASVAALLAVLEAQGADLPSEFAEVRAHLSAAMARYPETMPSIGARVSPATSLRSQPVQLVQTHPEIAPIPRRGRLNPRCQSEPLEDQELSEDFRAVLAHRLRTPRHSTHSSTPQTPSSPSLFSPPSSSTMQGSSPPVFKVFAPLSPLHLNPTSPSHSPSRSLSAAHHRTHWHAHHRTPHCTYRLVYLRGPCPPRPRRSRAKIRRMIQIGGSERRRPNGAHRRRSWGRGRWRGCWWRGAFCSSMDRRLCPAGGPETHC
ncbi:hypothetical protein B0H17DRAFT_1339235, partial [Mycena rosella]